jgi:hypothetical protein
MHTMSLYESGDSTGRASIGDMLEDQLNEGHTGKKDGRFILSLRDRVQK